MATIFRAVCFFLLCAVPMASVIGMAFLVEPELLSAVSLFGIFGMWSLLCIGAGACLGRRTDSGGLPPIDPQRMFNWIRHGDANGNSNDKEVPSEEPKGPEYKL
jgi:hypothetical protein